MSGETKDRAIDAPLTDEERAFMAWLAEQPVRPKRVRALTPDQRARKAKAMRAWKKRNPERVRAIRRAFNARNRDRLNAKQRATYAAKRAGAA